MQRDVLTMIITQNLRQNLRRIILLSGHTANW